ncbi:phage scaffolding protein [Clostridium fessum]|uniref:phage scaffolding protein n=1 Tax=Clostridium fessum TaxID=2126740 RepID=UPI0022E5720A|nr:phage scaffolding protein [Clostridium fessum]
MEWLKEILEKAVITDGKLDVEAAVKAINAEFPKHAVPKQDYNDKVKELSTASETIKDLKKNNADNAELQQKVKDYEAETARLKTEADNTRKEYALKDKLKEAGVTDADYIIYKQGGLDKFTFDKDGKVIGLDDVLKPMRESSPHLFKNAGGAGGYDPAGGGKPPVNNPFAKETYNLTEQGRLFKQNPEQARQMAAAAGVKL